MSELDEDQDKKMTLALPEGELEFDADRYLTRSILSHIKSWYPDDRGLGTYWGFQQNLGTGDPDAVACAIWTVRKKEGYSPNPEPRSFGRKIGDADDFAVGQVAIKPNRRAGLDPPRWQLKLDDDEEYTLDMDEDVKCSHLRQISKWYPGLGTFASLYINLLRGDPDAVACAIWLVRSARGVNPNPNPRDLEDFSVGVVSAAPNLTDVFDEPVSPPKESKTEPLSDGIQPSSSSGSSVEIPTTSTTDTPEV